jgi:hypothetical protein
LYQQFGQWNENNINPVAHYAHLKIIKMKKTNRIYWIATGLFALGMLGSAIPDILVSPVAVEGFQKWTCRRT